MKQKSIKNIRKEFRKNGVFYTPPELAMKLKEYVGIKPRNVYDPTCGAGNLLMVFEDDVEKYGQEIDAEQLETIDIPLFHGACGDTLMNDGFPYKKFDCIVANPPFSVSWNPEELINDPRFKDAPAMAPRSKADWAFMLHILYHLTDDGIAIVLEFPGILYRGQSEGKIRQWFIENNYIDRVVNIPGNTFEDTSIATCIIVLKKNRDKTSITFENDGLIREVGFDEIAAESYSLSPNIYVYEEAEKEIIDPVWLQEHARKEFVISIRKQLDFEKAVCGLEGTSIQPLLEEIKKIITEYEEKIQEG